jgi:type I restriction enzyme R subunit
MELRTAQVQRHLLLSNPTVVVITDRNELDGPLYSGFQISQLLPERAVKIRTPSELRAELSGRLSGGILFTTLQKFGRTTDERFSGSDHPLLSDRRNIIVVVDEAHRSHYDDLDNYAKHLRDALPNVTLIAFTGTPISTPNATPATYSAATSTSLTCRGRSTTRRRLRSISSLGWRRSSSPRA